MATTERQDWEAFQVRCAILYGLVVFHRRVAVCVKISATGRQPSQKEMDELADECARYAEAALLRVRSLAGKRASLGAMVRAFEAVFAAEAAAGRRIQLEYENERGNRTVLAPADFLRELVAAFNRRPQRE